MKKLMCSLFAVAALVPFSRFAQAGTDHVTRAEVRAELAQLEAVGYRPSTHDADYPQALMAAESKVAANNDGHAAYGGAYQGEQANDDPRVAVHRSN
ncbi:DUF4148 domain-containing protein [Caballeronia sp. LZ035]|uniref:DUF4148 domain-containing protein n=1 Tax=Caballeronia sp. LZ035 TaxID=3038568 RepID=UPI0028614D2B|nr:DUF4148 domain-containing protein [Caballeronia sp. LZ035]MDR5757137.1 DUF4148 domain-containing protein [Caballeronia sp. LZ035]